MSYRGSILRLLGYLLHTDRGEADGNEHLEEINKYINKIGKRDRDEQIEGI